jgi:hypothetical protein
VRVDALEIVHFCSASQMANSPVHHPGVAIRADSHQVIQTFWTMCNLRFNLETTEQCLIEMPRRMPNAVSFHVPIIGRDAECFTAGKRISGLKSGVSTFFRSLLVSALVIGCLILIAFHGFVRGISALTVVVLLTAAPKTHLWKAVEKPLVRLTGSRRGAAALALSVVIGVLLLVNIYSYTHGH